MKMTYDQVAAEILMDTNLTGVEQADKLAALLERANRDLDGRVPCPECGDEGPHDDNGVLGPERCFCCNNCGEHFEPELEVEV